MKIKSIRFAYAVNLANRFEVNHFGDADKYLIYEWTDGELIFIKEETNSFKNFDDVQLSGLSIKGMACINLLEKDGVNVLVSRQFGKNIQTVNKLFIPVIVNSETTDEVVSILKKHIRWIEDELTNKTLEYKLFTIRNGILKTIIKKDN
jgi:predicted Fe-Mo cluster-binding NifX family protein